MSAQDLGDLQDYILNGDNWTQITPTGTLVIPGQYGQQPLVAIDTRDTYRTIGNTDSTCVNGNCGLFAHDAYTGQYALLKVAGFGTSINDCLCDLAGDFLSTDDAVCRATLQKFVDDSDGQILYDVFPQWLLQELGILNQEFTATVLFDFWFTGCYGGLIDIPNLPSAPPPIQIQRCLCGVPI
jgi:hypothetical protein